ncbi:MAG: FAD-binding oxidoreductase [Deltaproteobacteria bacterium]|nr:FAD-binding oxidoreductase [Deltaproteobacteria bacterium]MBW1961803.1 FAD-binding oxidoreductase [Deltaproteobacteria bacterium]MBW1995093.1 FAD-binding oxidoreductase [Deltaproteobacteria bacterium]MBW2152259.1 FAD-binding oxidoreductase [Deltaproteobacteria bacterium]
MHPDVIVIGAGAIGTACAYYLTRRGISVLVLERRHICAGASGASAAIIFNAGFNANKAPLQRLNSESHRLIAEIEQDFEKPIEKIAGGSLQVAMNEQEAHELRFYYEQINHINSGLLFLEETEARCFEPMLGPRVVAALYDPADFHVNPYRLCEGYLKSALRRGGKVEFGVTVTGIRVQNGRIDRVVTDKGDYRAQWVVVAAGAWTPQILRSIHMKVPIMPARGQVIITEPCSQLTQRIIKFFDHLYIKQTANGNFYLGSHSEFAGFENRITLEKITHYMQFYSRAVPLFTRLCALRFFAGFRPISTDDIPIIGPVPGCPRLILATGHGRSGMCFSAATGKLVSEFIIDGKTEIPIGAFSVDRFSRMQSQENL